MASLHRRADQPLTKTFAKSFQAAPAALRSGERNRTIGFGVHPLGRAIRSLFSRHRPESRIEESTRTRSRQKMAFEPLEPRVLLSVDLPVGTSSIPLPGPQLAASQVQVA